MIYNFLFSLWSLVVMLEKEGFLEYVAKIIWNMASRSLDDLSSNPMLVAHCIGAMKTVAGLILSDTAPERYKCCFYIIPAG